MRQRVLLPCAAVLLVGSSAFGQPAQPVIDYIEPPSVELGSTTPVAVTGSGFYDPTGYCPSIDWPPEVRWYPNGSTTAVILTVTGPVSGTVNQVTVQPPVGTTWSVLGTGSLTVTRYVNVAGGPPPDCQLSSNPSAPYPLAVVPPPPPPLVASCGTDNRAPLVAIAGQPFSHALVATGGVPPYLWTSQEIATGVALGNDGIVSGVFTADSVPGVTFAPTVQDSSGSCPPDADVCIPPQSASTECTIAVQLPPVPVITSQTPPSATACGPAFNLGVTGVDFLPGAVVRLKGTWPYYAKLQTTVTSGTGLLASVPQTLLPAAGTYTFFVDNPTGSGWLSSPTADFPVLPTPRIQGLNPTTAPAGSGPLSLAITGSNFVPGVTVALWGPSGIPLAVASSTTSQMSVTVPASLLTAGEYAIRVVNRDGSNPTGTPYADTCSPPLTFLVGGSLAITQTDLPQGKVGVSYPSVTFAATGGNGPYTFTIAAGGVPGLALANGVFGGTPTTAGTYPITIQVSDSSAPASTASRAYSVLIQPPDLQIAGPASLPGGSVGVAYGPVSFTASGGVGSYSWDLATGQVPGLTLSAAGILTGTPTQAGEYSIQVRVTDGASTTATRSYTVNISQSPVILPDVAALPAAIVQRSYSATFTAQGGAGGYVWALEAGAAPGLALDSGGVLSGKPTEANTFSLTVRVTDSAGQHTSRTYSLTVGPPPAPELTLSSTQPQNPTDQSTVSPLLLTSVEDNLDFTFKLDFTANAAGVPPGYRDRTLALAPTGPITITPQNAGSPPNLRLSLGTVAGTVTVSVDKCYVSGTQIEVELPQYPSTTVEIRRMAPVIVPGSVYMTQTQIGLSVELDGYSTPRELSGAVVTFTPASGAQLNGATTSTVDFSSVAAAWYTTQAGLDAGSTFHLSLPFPVTGDLSAIGSVSVQLRNSVGASAVESGRMR